jgi:PilZ domain-containing protein
MRSPRVIQQRAKRLEVHLESTLRYGAFQQAPLMIENLSFTGLAGRCPACVAIGSPVSVGLPGIGLVRSRIVRRRQGRIGVQFERPVDIRKCFALE